MVKIDGELLRGDELHVLDAVNCFPEFRRLLTDHIEMVQKDEEEVSFDEALAAQRAGNSNLMWRFVAQSAVETIRLCRMLDEPREPKKVSTDG